MILSKSKYINLLSDESQKSLLCASAIELSRELLKNGYSEDAIEVFNKLFSESSLSLPGYLKSNLEKLILELSESEFNNGKPDRAIALLKMTIDNHSGLFKATFRLGEYLKRNGDTDGSKICFNNTFSDPMHRKDSAYQLAKIAIENKDIEKAEKYIFDAVDVKRDHSSYYVASNLFKNIDAFHSEADQGRIIRIALLASFTIDNLLPVLDVECRRIRLHPNFYKGKFNQFSQEILNFQSDTYTFNPDIIILALQSESLVPSLANKTHLPSESKAIIAEALEQIELLVKTCRKQTEALLLIHNFISPPIESPGVIFSRDMVDRREVVESLNLRLNQVVHKHNNVYVLDVNAMASYMGKEQTRDDRLFYWASMEYSNQFTLNLIKGYIAHIKAFHGMIRKCLVVDLDNTLWGGIIGEDGLEGIKLGPEFPGNVFYDLQKYILNLFEHGVILAINSKNNMEDAMKVFDSHPHMILKKKHFASMRINWQDKVTNMKEIADEINIGIDSLVFIDDNPVERAFVREMLPQVFTVELPDDPVQFKRVLSQIDDFERLKLTKEDRERGRMYAAEFSRKTLMDKTPDRDEFIRSLEMILTFRKCNTFSIPRVAQLIQRTNQFNLTAKRYTEADIKNFCSEERSEVFTLSVKDRFGEYGLVGVAILLAEESNIRSIDSFLLSCRVLGREVENIFLMKILSVLSASLVTRVIASYIPTKKNTQTSDFYLKNGFDEYQRKDDTVWFEYLVKENVSKIPDLAKIIEG